MRQQIFFLAFLTAHAIMMFLLPGASSMAQIRTSATPPIAKQIPHELIKFKDKRQDPYFWMRDRDSKPVLEYLTAENTYVDTVMKPTTTLQEKLVKEIRSRMKEDDQSAPYKKGDYFYYTRFEKGAEYPIFCRKFKDLKAPEEIMLNVAELAKNEKYFDVSRVNVSKDQMTLLYAVDKVGRRFYDLHFKDLRTKKDLPDVIESVSGNVVWLNDNKTILYTRQDPETLRTYQVFKQSLGEKKPQLLYEEKDPQYYVYVSKSLTQNEIYMSSVSNSAAENRVASADDLSAKFKLFYKRQAKHEYSIYDGGDRYFILTNYKAKNFQLMQTAKDQTDRKYWKTVVPHRADTLVEDVLVLKDYIVLEERAKGLTQLSYFKRNSKNPDKIKLKQIKFPDPTYTTNIGTNAEYESSVFRYDYQSLTAPETTYDFDFSFLASVIVKVADVPTYDPKNYASERVWALAKDKTKIPVSIVYRKDTFKKGENPLYISGYGSYGLSSDPYFRRTVISLLDRGFVFAIAHIRGGSEMGRSWYEDGKLLHKKNTFTDFIAATEFLLKKGFGQAGHVYTLGGSAGGLLMGSILNLRPDLYNGAIAAVPFVDVLTTMLDDTIPLTTNEYDEWGNPNDKKFYAYMKSYSPYDNVKKQKYPNILVTTGYHDSQVQYWEPAKWIAKLRASNTSKNLILFKTDMTAGHSGTTGRFESLKEDGLEFAFFLMLEGITE
jgi:oligopeptidase B